MFLLLTLFKTTLSKNSPICLFILYCCLLFSLSGGPSVTCYIFPSELYPKNIRSTFNGISAACGKLGAVVGAYMFGPMAEYFSFEFVFIFCIILTLIAAYITHVLIPDEIDTSSSSNEIDSVVDENGSAIAIAGAGADAGADGIVSNNLTY